MFEVEKNLMLLQIFHGDTKKLFTDLEKKFTKYNDYFKENKIIDFEKVDKIRKGLYDSLRFLYGDS
jgi:hypothetical protein